MTVDYFIVQNANISKEKLLNPLKDIIKATNTAIEDTAELKKLFVSKIG